MAKVTISDSYIGRAPKAIKWEELLRPIHSPQCYFKYWPAKTEASIEVHVSERETVCRLIRHTAYSIRDMK